MRAIFVGRFQPIHLGHLAIISKILDEVDELIVVVAAAQISHTFKNPLTAGERIQLILDAVKHHGVDIRKVLIVPAQDVNDNSLWVQHLKRLLPPFDVLYSNNPFTIRLFKEMGIEVRRTEMIERHNFSATQIRNMIAEHKDLTGLLLPSTINFLKSWDIQGRMDSIRTDDTVPHAGSELNKD